MPDPIVHGAMEPVDFEEKFAMFSEHWRPKTIAELNGQEFKAVKIKGEFPWHQHDVDEMFIAWRGSFRLEFRDRSVEMRSGQLIVRSPETMYARACQLGSRVG